MNAENWVVKSNALIESKGNFTALELKVIIGLISEIKIDDGDFKEYELSVEDLKKAIGTSTKNFYKELKKACEKLVSKTITIEKDIDEENSKKLKKRKSFLITSYLSSAEYTDGENKIKLCFDPKLKPYLLELQGSFTKYQLKNIFTLKSLYSIRIYELTKPMQGTSHQKRTMLLKDLKEVLGIEEKEYSRVYDFEKYVLKVAEKEISEKTDIVLTYEKIKKGKRVHAIEFNVSTKECVDAEERACYSDFICENAIEVRKHIPLPKTFSDSQVMELYEIASEKTEFLEHINRFQYMIENYKEMESKTGIKSKFAYYKKALEKDFASACLKYAQAEGQLYFVDL